MRTKLLVTFSLLIMLPTIAVSSCSAQSGLPPCEWCGAIDAPPRSELTNVMIIPDDDEPGDRIVITGQVFETDGETPAPGVLMYAYHTDINGIYRKDGDETGNGLRHGALRGWLITDDEGRYEIHTIRPYPYPSRREAAHIHITLTPPNGEEHWLDSILFKGDDLITERERREAGQLGRFNRIVAIEENEDGIFIGECDLRMRDDRRYQSR